MKPPLTEDEKVKLSFFLGKDPSLSLFPKDSSPKLFVHQQREVLRMAYDLFITGNRCHLTEASGGSGKTYIAGQFIKWIADCKYAEDKTLGSTKVFYITKASIVEQTERVLSNLFQIDTKSWCQVTNYDNLRSNEGKRDYLNKKVKYVKGEEVEYWEWQPLRHPVIFFFDECQAAKNINTQQSKIVQAVAEIKNDYVKVIFMSATPFTRVIEAMALAVNCHKPFEQ